MSARPGRIKAEIAVPLPRPRTLDATTDPAFVALKREIFGLIREESLKVVNEPG
jgi:NitT/TauT family transport system ATP-binding protein